MNQIIIANSFNAPVYYEETVTSTMDISRKLAEEGKPHGTVIVADFQKAGRGRIRGRTWEMYKSLNLAFTIFLRYPLQENIPAALTLRAGLAVLNAIKDFAGSLPPNNEGQDFHEKIKIKWPNDIMLGGKKCAGILCEADGLSCVYIGIGINVNQKEFPVHLRSKATSIAVETGINLNKNDRFYLLEKILTYLYSELNEKEVFDSWRTRLDQYIYKKGERVVFEEGAADSGKKTNGCLSGIGNDGELLILPDGRTEQLSFFTGELIIDIN